MFSWIEFDIYIAALCAWREAANQGRDGIRAVLHVIANRATLDKKSWAWVVFQYEQFSSMTAPGDPQIKSDHTPQNPDPVFVDCYEIAASIANGGDFDLTDGATHYFADSIPMPAWAASMTFLVQIGAHRFYR